MDVCHELERPAGVRERLASPSDQASHQPPSAGDGYSR